MSIKEINVDEAIKINGGIKKEEEKDIEQISLSQSLNSQDNGKTFKDIISFNQSNDKNNNYSNVIELIKNRQILSDEDYSKFYQLDKLAKSIKEINIDEAIKNNNEIKENEEKDIEQISLSQSLHSQDNGKTFKDIISFNETKDKNNNEIDMTKILFYPPKEEGWNSRWCQRLRSC
jgi:hypothetical protein